MVPIVLSVLDQLHESGIGENSKDDSISIAIENDAFDESLEKTQDFEKPEKPENNETTTETEFTDLTNQAKENENPETENSTENDDNSSFTAETEPEIRRSALDIGLLLSVPFAASIGGTGTFTGTDLNLYLAGFYKDYYSNTSGENFQGKLYRYFIGIKAIEINFSHDFNILFLEITYTNWAMYALFPSFLTFFLAYVWLQGKFEKKEE